MSKENGAQNEGLRKDESSEEDEALDFDMDDFLNEGGLEQEIKQKRKEATNEQHRSQALLTQPEEVKTEEVEQVPESQMQGHLFMQKTKLDNKRGGDLLGGLASQVGDIAKFGSDILG